MRTVLMEIDALHFFGIDISGNVWSLVDNKD